MNALGRHGGKQSQAARRARSSPGTAMNSVGTGRAALRPQLCDGPRL